MLRCSCFFCGMGVILTKMGNHERDQWGMWMLFRGSALLLSEGEAMHSTSFASKRRGRKAPSPSSKPPKFQAPQVPSLAAFLAGNKTGHLFYTTKMSAVRVVSGERSFSATERLLCSKRTVKRRERRLQRDKNGTGEKRNSVRV